MNLILGVDEMDPIWKTAIKVTGIVGVVGLLFSILIKQLFQKEIVTLLGSDRMFYIIIFLICIFGIAIITAIFKENNSKTSSPKVIYKDHSKHNGNNRF